MRVAFLTLSAAAIAIAATGCTPTDPGYNQAIRDYAKALNDSDNATIALFKHLKPSDIDECKGREALIDPMQYATRNSVLLNCSRPLTTETRGSKRVRSSGLSG